MHLNIVDHELCCALVIIILRRSRLLETVSFDAEVDDADSSLPFVSLKVPSVVKFAVRPTGPVALRPNVPHLKLLRERGSFIHALLCHEQIFQPPWPVHFPLASQGGCGQCCCSSYVGVVCHGAAWALRAREGRKSVYDDRRKNLEQYFFSEPNPRASYFIHT